MLKPVEYYDQNDWQSIAVDSRATVFVPARKVYRSTSEVIRKGDSGEFETLNTIYRPARKRRKK